MASSGRISIRIGDLQQDLEEEANRTGKQEAELVREALREFLNARSRGVNCYDLARSTKILGVVVGAPRDLSTNRRHFDGFGKE